MNGTNNYIMYTIMCKNNMLPFFFDLIFFVMAQILPPKSLFSNSSV